MKNPTLVLISALYSKRSFSSSDAYDDVDVFVSGSGSNHQTLSGSGSSGSGLGGGSGSRDGRGVIGGGSIGSGGNGVAGGDLEGHQHHQGLLDEKEEDLLT